MGAGRGPTGGKQGGEEGGQAGWRPATGPVSPGRGVGWGAGAQACGLEELGEGAQKIPGTNLKRPEKSNKERGLTALRINLGKKEQRIWGCDNRNRWG